MTPAARAAAAIDLLDRIRAGTPAEQALTNWARASRFAGSGDRAAVRDLVFEALRCRRSAAALGGAETGRGLLIGLWRARGSDPDEIFCGGRYGPAPLEDAERSAPPGPSSETEALDCPEWLAPRLRASLGADFAPVMELLRHRAPLFLRVNIACATSAEAVAALAADGIAAQPHPLAPTALLVTSGMAGVRRSAAFGAGLVEVQDAASQAVVAALPLRKGDRVLDFCAGGGGKTLAIAARTGREVAAHDADPGRMSDLPARAARAGADVRLLTPGRVPAGAFDLVLADAPCSGSGAWRRNPEGKWRLDPDTLARRMAEQDAVLDAAARAVGPGGVLAYATCSLLDEENGARVRAFAARSGWRLRAERRFTPLEGGDGFYLALLDPPSTGAEVST
jgi:16S rRNA (cytosine967-C5)-methyltransferase